MGVRLSCPMKTPSPIWPYRSYKQMNNLNHWNLTCSHNYVHTYSTHSSPPHPTNHITHGDITLDFLVLTF